jgi:hypothetical protein
VVIEKERAMDVMRYAAVALAVPLLGGSVACSRQAEPLPPYTPALGEIMTLTQMRHIKLWFAGEAGNWALASYELDELKEGFDDAATYHAAHKDSPLPIDQLIAKVTTDPLEQLEAAVTEKDRAKFTVAYDALTGACNSCHEATNFGFNVVGRPTSNPYTNQLFQPPQPGSPISSR